ncbi:PadR family transcriptional regulator [Enteractinococcus coprophilus]|uniref:PadR family transcriptional regulator n=1 Tax=Enteractinococcus coprophilus TaxID=1027633 RepID=A0A543AN24_9MICC|nr:PadR family transcriptional regulator [Enteractinococcus coprophilus]TQL73991.1 PadR family transcriptional regulator [Enteractinococcus coprophilus]
MSLRSALLTLLSAGPHTGYDLAKNFHSSVGFLWHAPDSQIYPELKKMQVEQLIEGYPVPWGSKGATKTEYAITDAGVEYLNTWQGQAVTYRPERSEVRLRAAYFEFAGDGDARSCLEGHLAHYRQVVEDVRRQIHELEEHASDIHQRRLARYQETEHAKITRFKIFAYEGVLRQAEAEIAWAQDGLAILDEPQTAESSPLA